MTINHQRILALGYTIIEDINIDLDYWVKQCYKYKNEVCIESKNRSSVGGYQSDSSIYKHPIFKSLTQFLNSALLKSNLTKDPTIEINNMWINISNYGHYNKIHTHQIFPQFFTEFSGILYLKVKENNGGLLSFKNPLDINMEYTHIPKNGQLILFPSYLPHEVTVYLGKEDRISLSFNYNMYGTTTDHISDLKKNIR